MRYGIIFLVLGIWNLEFAPLKAQTAQQQSLQQEKAQQGPVLYKYDTTYLASVEAEREDFLRKKTLIDSMDISENFREKLIKDLYKAKPTKRLSKALLAATITKEEDLTGDPDNPQ